jgi:hypothetical protein
MRRPSKAKGSARPGLPELAPEARAALEDQVARVAAALEQGQDPAALEALLTLRPQDPAFDVHLIAALGALPHPAVPALLAAAFGSTPDKVRLKALKRALHSLKTRGVAVPPELLPREEASVGVPRPAAAQAYVSPVFGNGDSYVILEGPREILGGNFLVALINDLDGFRECHLLNLNQKQQKEFWSHFSQQGLVQRLPVPPPYAVNRLEEAYRAAPQAEPWAGRYAGWRQKILATWGRPEDAAGPEQLLPPISPGEAVPLLEQSASLAADPLFRSWLPSLEHITPWLKKIKEVEESPLVLTEAQRQVRVQGVVDEATRALFPSVSRPHLSRRLKTMAYYLDLLGRGEQARAVQAAADDLVGDRHPLVGENPFLKGLVQISLRLAWETLGKPREGESSSGLVVPPRGSLLIGR